MMQANRIELCSNIERLNLYHKDEYAVVDSSYVNRSERIVMHKGSKWIENFAKELQNPGDYRPVYIYNHATDMHSLCHVVSGNVIRVEREQIS